MEAHVLTIASRRSRHRTLLIAGVILLVGLGGIVASICLWQLFPKTPAGNWFAVVLSLLMTVYCLIEAVIARAPRTLLYALLFGVSVAVVGYFWSLLGILCFFYAGAAVAWFAARLRTPSSLSDLIVRNAR